MPRLSKKFAVLLVLAMLASMFVGMGTVSASSTYAPIQVPAVSAGQTYNSGDNNMFNRIGVTIAGGSITGVTPATYGSVRISLPADTYCYIPQLIVAPAQIPGTSTANGILKVTATGVAGTLMSSQVNARNVYREYDIALDSCDGSTVLNGGYFSLDMANFVVPGGANGSINASFDAAPSSPFSSGTVTIATVGSGIVNLAVDKATTISSTGGTIEALKIKEDRPGAIADSNTSLKFKLPPGFTWADPAAIDISRVYGNIADPAPNAGILTRTDSERTLVFKNNATAGANNDLSTQASFLSIAGLQIVVDDTTAKLGDVVVTVTGDSTVGQTELTVAKYGTFSVSAAAFGDPKDVKAGRVNQEIGKIKITEGLARSLVDQRTITLTLTGGAKWYTAPINDAANSKNTPALVANASGAVWTANGSVGDSIKCTINGWTANPAEWVLQKGYIDVSAAAEGDIKIIFGGTAGVTGEAVVAKAVKPATITLDGNPAEIVAGTQGGVLADFIITEAMKEGIDSAGTSTKTGYQYLLGQYYRDANGNGAFDVGTDYYVGYDVATAANNAVFIEFPMDTKPSLPSKIEVVEGDIVIDQNSIALDVTPDARWFIKFTTKSTSSTPSKIKVSGVKLNVERNYYEGDIKAALKGSAVVQTTTQFPGYTSISSCLAAKVVTPADNAGKSDGVFVIGQTSFKLFGVEKTMEAAPYIKDGRTFLPLAYVAQALGVTPSNIIWDPANQTVTLMKGDKVVQVKIGSTTMLVNGAAVTMDAAPEIVNGRTCLPIALIAQAFGASANWDPATQTVTIK